MTANIKIKLASRVSSTFHLSVDTEVPGTGITGIFGTSGSGKTTFLRCIAGLHHAEGTLVVAGTTWQDTSTFVPTHKRSLGYVFQEQSLLPHLSVEGNLDYVAKRSESISRTARSDIINQLGIGSLLVRSPEKLSGGERQRVAIARALMRQPSLLLMDEPLASLDIAHREEILPYLETLHDSLAVPMLYVSHASEEIARIADHILVMDDGQVVDSGDVSSVMNAPAFPTASQDDVGVLITGKIGGRDDHWHLDKVLFPGGEIWVRSHPERNVGQKLRIRILAKDISLSLSEHEDSSFLNKLPATVTAISVEDHPAMQRVRLDVGGNTLFARLTSRSVDHLNLATGTRVVAQIKSVAIVN
ncbi:MAG: molybdenum ABC transporter ATP-binding protein [Pseudomonadales bacterium]|nr:molybdenum ABC transporter ATP-binding protein [Pseudomonadales bacterium]